MKASEMECSASVLPAIFLTKSYGEQTEKTRSFQPKNGCREQSAALRIRTAPLRQLVTKGHVGGRTTAPHGISHHEVDRAKGAAKAMADTGCILWAVTIALHGQDLLIARSVIEDFYRQLGQEQQRAGAQRRYILSVWHGKPSPHVHMIVALPKRARKRLKRLAARKSFAQYDSPAGKCVRYDPIVNLDGWIGYMLGETTPQAVYGFRKAPRRRGTHRLDGGGDRVRLSPDLKADAIEMGWVRPWQRTNSKRSKPHAAKLSMPTLAPQFVMNAVVPEPVQLSLLPDQPINRLSRYAGGKMPPAVALEIETRRRWQGMSQEHLAETIGISRPQLTNVLCGRFGLSKGPAQRLREFLLTA